MQDGNMKHTSEQVATVSALDVLVKECDARIVGQPKKKWLEKEPVFQAYDGPESDLQNQLDDFLAAYRIWSIRIPDAVWRWIAWKAPQGVKKWWRGIFGGIPDVLPMLRVSDKYMLCAPIELKNKAGKLHGKQKHWEGREISVQISRSPDESIAIVDQFRRDAEKIRSMLNEIK